MKKATVLFLGFSNPLEDAKAWILKAEGYPIHTLYTLEGVRKWLSANDSNVVIVARERMSDGSVDQLSIWLSEHKMPRNIIVVVDNVKRRHESDEGYVNCRDYQRVMSICAKGYIPIDKMQLEALLLSSIKGMERKLSDCTAPEEETIEISA